MPVIKTTADTTGMIKFIPATHAAALSGYLYCDGSVVSRTTYSALFSRIGASFNTGGESTLQFRLPDLRGKISVGNGQDTSRSLTARAFAEYGGAETHALTVTQVPTHAHTGTTNNQSATHTHTASLDSQLNNTAGVSMDTHTHNYTYTTWTNDSDDGGGKASQAGNAWGTSGTNGSLAHTHTYTTGAPDTQHNHTFTTGPGNGLLGQAHSNIQPCLVGGFYIKY